MTKPKRYRVLTGINYPPGDRRAEPGDIVDDIPPSSLRWLLEDGIIEPYVARKHTPVELAGAAEAEAEPTEEERAAEAGADAAAAIDALDDQAADDGQAADESEDAG